VSDASKARPRRYRLRITVLANGKRWAPMHRSTHIGVPGDQSLWALCCARVVCACCRCGACVRCSPQRGYHQWAGWTISSHASTTFSLALQTPRQYLACRQALGNQRTVGGRFQRALAGMNTFDGIAGAECRLVGARVNNKPCLPQCRGRLDATPTCLQHPSRQLVSALSRHWRVYMTPAAACAGASYAGMQGCP
jgi:hypothetical protein